MVTVRNYATKDYQALKELYLDSSTFGGQFDEARDSEVRINNKIQLDPEAILIAESGSEVVGSVSLIEDSRVAWLFRFAIKNNNQTIYKALHSKAVEILKKRGHSQIVVYAPAKNDDFKQRYLELGFNKGNDFTAFWQEI